MVALMVDCLAPKMALSLVSLMGGQKEHNLVGWMVVSTVVSLALETAAR